MKIAVDSFRLESNPFPAQGPVIIPTARLHGYALVGSSKGTFVREVEALVNIKVAKPVIDALSKEAVPCQVIDVDDSGIVFVHPISR